MREARARRHAVDRTHRRRAQHQAEGRVSHVHGEASGETLGSARGHGRTWFDIDRARPDLAGAPPAPARAGARADAGRDEAAPKGNRPAEGGDQGQRGTGPARGRHRGRGESQGVEGPRLAELLHALRRRPLPLRGILQSAAPRGPGRDREQPPARSRAGRHAVRVQRRGRRHVPSGERQHQRPDLDQPDAHRQLHAVQRQPRLGLPDPRARQDVRHPAGPVHAERRQVSQPDVQGRRARLRRRSLARGLQRDRRVTRLARRRPRRA